MPFKHLCHHTIPSKSQFLCFNQSWVKLFPFLEICKSSVQTREGSQIQQFKWKCCLTSTPNRIRGELNLLAMSDAWWSTDVFPPKNYSRITSTTIIHMHSCVPSVIHHMFIMQSPEHCFRSWRCQSTCISTE